MTKEDKQLLLQELEKEGVKFLPWIGDKYDEGIYYDEEGVLQLGGDKGKRLLILNECIYWGGAETDAINCVGQDNQSYLIYKIIERFIDPQSNFYYGINHRTYIRFERTLAGKERLTLNERADLWNHVAFYTFIQKIITEVEHFKPTEKQYEEAKKIFLNLLEKCQPDFIIVWGRRLYDNLSLDGEQGCNIITEDEYTETWKIQINNHVIEIIPISHPSYAGFILSNWHEIIKEALTRK